MSAKRTATRRAAEISWLPLNPLANSRMENLQRGAGHLPQTDGTVLGSCLARTGFVRWTLCG